jgi:hypothetical protein
MNKAAGMLRLSTLAALTLVWLVVPVLCVCLGIFALSVWAARAIRSLHNICRRNATSWGTMTLIKRQAWLVLGWTPQRWAANAAPVSSSKGWSELRANEQLSARRFGYGP